MMKRKIKFLMSNTHWPLENIEAHFLGILLIKGIRHDQIYNCMVWNDGNLLRFRCKYETDTKFGKFESFTPQEKVKELIFK